MVVEAIKIANSTPASFTFRRALIHAYVEHMRERRKRDPILDKIILQYNCFPPPSWRNTIREFVCGWGECLRHKNDAVGIQQWAREFSCISDNSWWPNDEWRFW